MRPHPAIPIATLALLAGCSDPPSAPLEPQRLSDLLAAATIDSPLTEIDSARGLDELGELKRETLLAEDFEDFDLESAGWPQALGGVDDVEGGRAFRMRAGPVQERNGWILPAQPNTHYLFERRVRTEGPLYSDFEVIEGDGERTLRLLLDPSTAWEGRARLRLHWPASPEPDGTWQLGSVPIFTSPRTKAIAVLLGTAIEHRADIIRQDWQAGHGAWVDDVRLVRVDPAPEQAIALLKAEAPADGADAELGMAKFGQFPPTPTVGTSHSAQEENFSFRPALYAPPPTDLTFPANLKGGEVLGFSACVARQTRPGHRARFEVLVRSGGDEKVLWTDTRAGAPRKWGWVDARVDLSAYAGQSVEIVFRTRAEQGHPHPLWGNPVLDTPRERAAPRNVILIAVDTLRADRLSCYGYHKETSPRIDALAQDGVRFEHVASNATWTCPSFASIFTGLVPSKHGVWAAGPAMRLASRFQTLAERFRANGWATHGIAYKAPLYNGGYEQGFDTYFNVPRVEVRAEDNLIEALEWLEANAERRNFLFLHFDDPHQPFTQPEPFDRTFGEDPASRGLELPINIHHKPPEDEALRDIVRGLYDGEIAYVDDRIGAFLDALKERGLYDNAVIAFVSDHGEELWEHGQFGHNWGSLFDESVRVPLIVKPSGGAESPGSIVETQVRGFDIMPTLLELAGIAIEDDLDAKSLVPLLAAGAGDAPDRIAVTETSNRGFGVRNRRWKYVLRPQIGREALVDLVADPAEKENVAEQHPQVVRTMRRQLLDYLLDHRPGRYLVVTAAPGDAVDVAVDDVQSTVPFFGLQPEVQGERARVTGTAESEVVTVAQVNASGSVVVNGEEREFVRYEVGELQRLLGEGTAGVHLFEGPPRMAEEIAPQQTMDLEQLEALRALGYTGDK